MSNKRDHKRRKKERRQAAIEAQQQRAATPQLLMPGINIDGSLQLPKGSRKFLIDYYTKHPGDSWRPKSNMDIADKAQATRRISSLLTIFYHIHSIQDTLFLQIERLMDDFGLWVPGLRPLMNDITRADDKYFAAMRATIDNGDDPEGCRSDYLRDFASLYEKFMRWERVPKDWEPGDEVKLPPLTDEQVAEKRKEGKIVVDTGYEQMTVTTVDLPNEVLSEEVDYSISKLLRDDTAEVVRQHIKTLRGARIAAAKLLKREPRECFVIYETHNRSEAAATLIPMQAYVNKEPTTDNE